MRDAVVSQPVEPLTRTPLGDGPDWSKVPFEVGCARCGANLRELTEPKCPACSLEFNWSEAVPIEQLTCLHCDYHLYGLSEPRCPECGEAFTWEHVLDDYHRRRKNLFEYRWREAPIRSFVGSLRAALRPGRFWRNIDLHDPPKPAALMAMPAIEFVSFYFFLVLVFATTRYLTLLGGYGPTFRLPKFDYWMNSFWRTAFSRDFLSGMLTLLAWWTLTFLGLLVFQQSMRLCRVRTAHVHRVCVYAVGPGLPIFALTLALLFLMRSFDVFSFRYMDTLLILSTGAYVAHATWSIRQGYRHYLKMRHCFGVAIAVQIMALLATSIVSMLIVMLLR